MRLIDADEIVYDNLLLLNGDKVNPYEWVATKKCIDDMPTIEERKTGRWIHIRTESDGNALYECSVCHKGEVHVPIVEVSYCWNCGARMQTECDGDSCPIEYYENGGI